MKRQFLKLPYTHEIGGKPGVDQLVVAIGSYFISGPGSGLTGTSKPVIVVLQKVSNLGSQHNGQSSFGRSQVSISLARIIVTF